jgi:hypothetical protein
MRARVRESEETSASPTPREISIPVWIVIGLIIAVMVWAMM